MEKLRLSRVLKYDAFGRRICKIVKERIGGGANHDQAPFIEKAEDQWKYEFYALDASGNTLATYEHKITQQSSCAVSSQSYAVLEFHIANNITSGVRPSMTIELTGANGTEQFNLGEQTSAQAFKNEFLQKIIQYGVDFVASSESDICPNCVKILYKEAGNVSYNNSSINVVSNYNSVVPPITILKPFGGGGKLKCANVNSSKLLENILYADSRLGILKQDIELQLSNYQVSASKKYSSIAGKRHYEIVNWLGSVLAVVKDMKYWETSPVEGTIYSTSFEGGDENMFRSTSDAQYATTDLDKYSGNKCLSLSPQPGMAWGHFGPNIRESVKVGNTIDIECYTKWNGTNSQRGGGIVYALIDEDNKFLLDANGNAQWREITLVSANGEPNDWRHQQLNGFVIPTLYKADGSGIPVDKATIHIYPAVGHGFQPTLFDDLRVSISRANEQESYFMAVIEESHDYHEFGMEMAGRGFSGSYRFGYQGSEKDNEVSGDGNSYTTEFRQLDPRLGRWFSVDPWEQKYPYISPYASMHNNPINLTDVRGLGPKNAKDKLVSSYQENTVIYNLYKSQDGKFYVEIADPNYVKSTYVEAEHFNGNVGEAYEYLANNTREFKQAYATQKANDEAKESKDAELKAQKLRDEEKALKKKEYIEKMSRIHQAEYGATGDSELDEARQEPTAKRLRKQAPKTYHAGDKDFFDVKPYWTAGDLGKVMLEKGKVVGMGGKSFYTAIKKAQVFRLNVSEINEAAVKHQVRGILRTLGAGNSFIIPYQDSQGKVTGYWYIEVKVDAKGNEVLIEKDEPRILIETQDVNKT